MNHLTHRLSRLLVLVLFHFHFRFQSFILSRFWYDCLPSRPRFPLSYLISRLPFLSICIASHIRIYLTAQISPHPDSNDASCHRNGPHARTPSYGGASKHASCPLLPTAYRSGALQPPSPSFSSFNPIQLSGLDFDRCGCTPMRNDGHRLADCGLRVTPSLSYFPSCSRTAQYRDVRPAPRGARPSPHTCMYRCRYDIKRRRTSLNLMPRRWRRSRCRLRVVARTYVRASVWLSRITMFVTNRSPRAPMGAAEHAEERQETDRITQAP